MDCSVSWDVHLHNFVSNVYGDFLGLHAVFGLVVALHSEGNGWSFKAKVLTEYIQYACTNFQFVILKRQLKKLFQ